MLREFLNACSDNPSYAVELIKRHGVFIDTENGKFHILNYMSGVKYAMIYLEIFKHGVYEPAIIAANFGAVQALCAIHNTPESINQVDCETGLSTLCMDPEILKYLFQCGVNPNNHGYEPTNHCSSAEILIVRLQYGALLTDASYHVLDYDRLFVLIEFGYLDLVRVAAHYAIDEECIALIYLAGIKLTKAQLTILKTQNSKFIKIVGFTNAKKIDFLDYQLRQYLTLIRSGRWNLEVLNADPCYFDKDYPIFAAIDSNRYDYVAALIFIIGKSIITLKKDSHNLLNYAIVRGKYLCAKVILRLLGDVSRHVLFRDELLDIIEYCMITNNIRCVEYLIGAGHATYSEHLDLYRFICKLPVYHAKVYWAIIKKRYIADRLEFGEPLSKGELYSICLLEK